MADNTLVNRARSWEDIANRMRNAGSKCQGVSAITIRVLVQHGRPVAWLSPNVQRIEPKGDAEQFAAWLEASMSA